jgi:hypothetical protein
VETKTVTKSVVAKGGAEVKAVVNKTKQVVEKKK